MEHVDPFAYNILSRGGERGWEMLQVKRSWSMAKNGDGGTGSGSGSPLCKLPSPQTRGETFLKQGSFLDVICPTECRDSLSSLCLHLHVAALQDKVECTEKLGDIIFGADVNVALLVYTRANAAGKVMAPRAFDKMVADLSKV